MNLPTLYKKTATGAIQQWEIWSAEDWYQTRFGQHNGLLQTSDKTFCKPKNVGRANETTAEQQAATEAKALWTKKLKDGYAQSLEEAKAGKTDSVVEGGIEPMLAQVYWDRNDQAYPAAAQPKLDGMRCIAQIDDKGRVTLWTRRRRPILSCPHIAVALERLAAAWKGSSEDLCGVFLDGEIYNHTHKDRFSELMSLARKGYPGEGYEQLEYHVYDCYFPQHSGLRFRERNSSLGLWITSADPGPLKYVRTVEVTSQEGLEQFYQECLADGYEGAIYRNVDAPYGIDRRSPYLLKVKPSDDNEYEIVGVKEGDGKMAGCAIFVCKSPKGAKDPTFDVVMACSFEERREYFTNKDKYIGKQLTVTHQGYTDYGQPRCPRGKAIRED